MTGLLAFFSSPLGQKILYWLGAKIFKAIGKFLVDGWVKIKRSITNKKNVTEYKQDVANPETPDEEVIQDGQDLLNGTRKSKRP